MSTQCIRRKGPEDVLGEGGFAEGNPDLAGLPGSVQNMCRTVTKVGRYLW